MNMNTFTNFSESTKRRRACSVIVDGKVYGPTNYQLSVWEYEGGCYLDPADDPLKHRKGFLAKTYNYFSKNLLSFF